MLSYGATNKNAVYTICRIMSEYNQQKSLADHQVMTLQSEVSLEQYSLLCCRSSLSILSRLVSEAIPHTVRS